jgi:hypothetical protein
MTAGPATSSSSTDHGVLVSRWHQRLAVALDTPLERLDPGADRLPEVLTAYLDTQRATTVRPRAGRLLLTVLEEDLAALGAVDPARSAADLLAECDGVVAVEDAAGRVLPRERAGLLPTGYGSARRYWVTRWDTVKPRRWRLRADAPAGAASTPTRLASI